MRLLLALLGIISALCASQKDPFLTAATEGEPSAFVYNCVNAITGDLLLSERDLIVRGAEPIILKRTYISGEGEGEGGGWFFQPHQELLYLKSHKMVQLVEPNGTTFFYTRESKKKARRAKGNIPFFLDEQTSGLTNRAGGSMGGRTHPKNISVEMEPDEKIFRVYGAGGTERCYKLIPDQKKTRKRGARYHLIWERLPNGNIVRYGYDEEHRLDAINTNNPTLTKLYAWVKFHYLKEDRPDFNIETSDGARLSYRYDDEQLLLTVDTDEHAHQAYSYLSKKKTCGPLLGSVLGLKNCQNLVVGYYRYDTPAVVEGEKIHLKDKKDPRCDSVRMIRLGSETLYTFLYHPKQNNTEVFDALGNRTIYRYSDEKRLEAIERYAGKDQLLQIERFEWQESNLAKRSLIDEKGQALIERVYRYDQWGNILEETLTGTLTGKGTNSYSKRYKYDEEDLLIYEEEDNGRGVYYSYLPGTHLVTAELSCYKEKIVKRRFYFYNEDHLLIQESVDDGSSQDFAQLKDVTHREIRRLQLIEEGPFQGMARAIDECVYDLETGEEKRLKRTEWTYNYRGKVETKKIYDAEGELNYTLHYGYDGRGRLISETNALGQIQKYGYDTHGNRNEICHFSGKLTEKIQYDRCNRPIQIERIAAENQVRTSSKVYDLLGNLVQETDEEGDSSFYTYDALGRRLSARGACPSETCTYDAAGNPLIRRNGLGEETKARYNAYNKPIEICHPDGSTERFLYYADGSLSDQFDEMGVRTRYRYDELGHVCSKALFSQQNALLAEETFSYKGDLLQEENNAEGIKTHYSYDCAGRKKSEQRLEAKRLFAYDSMGRLKTVQQGDLIQEYAYDLLDRLILETTAISSIEYAYDAAGNKSSITRLIDGQRATEHFSYDPFGRPEMQIDALGQTSRIAYHSERHQKIFTDPRGVQTIETYNPQKKKMIQEVRSSLGDLLTLTQYEYDAAGQMTRQAQGDQIIETHYGPRGRVAQLIEAPATPEEKITRTRYNARGQIDQLTRPDGTVLTHRYNLFGHLIELSSSDGTVHYVYKYDRMGRLLTCRDERIGREITRSYDAEGRLTKEILLSGIELYHHYDEQGQRVRLQLPDGSGIGYRYEKGLLKTVTRLNTLGQPLYEHHYLTYDLAGNPLTESLIAGLGILEKQYNPAGHPIKIHSSHFEQTVDALDPAGNPTAITLNGETQTYVYDEQSQLLSENGHSYTYDSNHNRLTKDGNAHTLNSLNQLTDHYTYDRNGNPISKNNVHYTYDALDRLIEAEIDSTRRIRYTYDGLHRCSSRALLLLMDGEWTEIKQEDFLYDDQIEIGSNFSTGYIHTLRILGRTPKADIGSAVAFEIDGQVYAPLYDIQGSVRTLLSVSEKTVAAQYTYTAFGESPSKRQKVRNPWQFASKRYDPDLHLYNFGRRFYDPDTGRFLTPDPKGFTDSLNLYAYVLNNPLLRADLFGLETQGIFGGLLGAAFQFIGKLIFNLIPNNPLRIFALMALNTFFGCTIPIDPPSHCAPEKLGSPGSGAKIIVQNGIMNNHDEVRSYAMDIQSSSQAEVSFVHNNTQGFLTDIYEAFKGLIGIQSNVSREIANNLRMQIATADPDSRIIAIAHSQGGIDLKNALDSLTADERARIDVRTFGSASIFEDNGYRSLEHYGSTRDPVVYLLSPLATLKAIFSPQNSKLRLVPSQGGFFDHSFNGPTYSMTRKKVLGTLIEGVE